MHAFDSSASFTRTPPPATGHDVLGTVEAIFAEMELTTVPVEPSAAGAIHERLTVPAELPVEAATLCMAAGQVIKVPKPGSRMLLAEVQLDAPTSATEATR